MSPTRGATLLVVEDDERDLELTLRALHKVNLHAIAVARDGVEALELLSGGAPPPRVVLLDVKLPRLDGLEVLRRLKSDPRTHAIPVVVLTSSKEERDVLTSYELGVNGYIVKPVTFERFIEVVGQIGLYWTVLNQPPPGAAT